MKKGKKLLSLFLTVIMCLTLYTPPAAKAASYTILETDVTTASTGCTMLGIYGTYYTDAAEALARINEIRYEACNAGNVPDPRNSSRMLQPSDYVPIKWSTDLERIARIRAMEGGVCYDFKGSGHNRLNDKSWSSVKFNGQSSISEDLAYNYDKNALDGIEQWYGEKSIWVNGGSGVTGHYTSMINPNYKYIGLGDFYTSVSRWPNTLSAEFATTSTTSSSYLPAYTNIMQKVEVKDTYISEYFLDGRTAIYIDETDTLTPKANLVNGTKTLTLWVFDTVTYSSSNTSVATVSSDGVVTAKGKGTVIITAKKNGTTLATKTITVSCKHNKTLISTVPATCTKKGTNTYTCSKCKETFDEEIPLAPHYYVYGTADSTGKATGVCANCSDTISIVPPTSYSIYWNNSTSGSNTYYPSIPSSNPKNSNIIGWLYSINGDSDYRDFIMKSSDENILSGPTLSGNMYYFKVLTSGIVTINAYPKYNPSIGKSYTVRVGDPGDIDIADVNFTLSQTEYGYNGTARQPSVTATYNGFTLSKGTDYTVAYENNINTGTASVIITGAGIFGGTTTIPFTIAGIDISGATVTLSKSTYEFDKTAKLPTVTVKLGATTLTKGTDYTVTYTNNTAIGTATVTVKGCGNYGGQVQKTFTIVHSSHTPVTISAVPATCTTPGLTAGSKCSLCDEILTAQQTIEALGHNYQATYAWDGYADCKLTLTCQNNTNHKVNLDMFVTDIAHKDATCTQDGFIDYEASISYDGNAYSDTKRHVFPALGHNYVPSYDWAEDYSTCDLILTCLNDESHIITRSMAVNETDKLLPTCTTTGYIDSTATVVYGGETYSDTQKENLPIAPDKHPANKIVTTTGVPATCTTNGYTDEKYCNACDTIFEPSKTITKLGHNYEPTYTWKDVFTFDDEALKTCTMKLTCANDSSHIVNNIEMSVKTVSIIDPTCTEDGSINYSASKTYNGVLYGDSTSDVILKLGHSYKPSYDWAEDYSSCNLILTCENDSSHIIRKPMNVTVTDEDIPTCISDGYRDYKASLVYNGKTYTDTTTEYLNIDPNNHETTETTYGYAATCTTAGYTDYIYCNDCNTVVQNNEVIPALGHNYTKKIISSKTLKSAATDTSPAIYYYSCSHCNDVGKTKTFTYGTANEAPDVDVLYHTHIQSLGDTQGTRKNGQMAGTSGMAKRLENIWINVEGNPNLGIQYSTHCQSYGWLPWSANGETNGTKGESKRLEAIKIQLTGPDASKYDVYYRVHAQSYGWLGWAKNGEPSGTAGKAKRLEGIQIVIKKKVNGKTTKPGYNVEKIDSSPFAYKDTPYVAADPNATITVPGNPTQPNVLYRTHVQSFGWQKWVPNGVMSGTSGQAKRLEGIDIKLTNKPYSGGIKYWTHIQTYGWTQGWMYDGNTAGTFGKAKRLEAIKIELYGEMEQHYDVYYRVHAQSSGWLGWAKNGEDAGTAGGSKRLEGIQIVLIPKGQGKPGNINGIISVTDQSFKQY